MLKDSLSPSGRYEDRMFNKSHISSCETREVLKRTTNLLFEVIKGWSWSESKARQSGFICDGNNLCFVIGVRDQREKLHTFPHDRSINVFSCSMFLTFPPAFEHFQHFYHLTLFAGECRRWNMFICLTYRENQRLENICLMRNNFSKRNTRDNRECSANVHTLEREVHPGNI